MKKPNWSFWQHMPEVELWQAVCLSLDVEPDELVFGHEVNDEAFKNINGASERLCLLITHRSDERYFSKVYSNKSDAHSCEIQMLEFAVWAYSVMRWEPLPSELVEPARAAQISKPADGALLSSAANFLRSAKLICQLADEDMLVHPESGLIPSPLIAMSIYQHVRIYSGNFSGINDYPVNAEIDREDTIFRALTDMEHLIGVGIRDLSIKQNRSKSDVFRDIPLSEFLELALRGRRSNGRLAPNEFVYFFVLALLHLTRFVETYNSAYRTLEQLKDPSEEIAAHERVIAALEALMCAQSALEKGMSFMMLELSTTKLEELNAKLAESSAEEETAQISGPYAPEPKGGDSLSPIIWRICNDLHKKKQVVRPRSVWPILKAMANTGCYPLVSITSGGIKYETGDGEELELNSDALRKRISGWRKALPA